VTKRISISAPASALGGVWDAHIVLHPLHIDGGHIAPASSFDDQAPSQTFGDTNTAFGPCWISTVPTGDKTFAHDSAVPRAGQGEFNQLECKNYVFGGAARIIAAGLEVSNTTAALHRGGGVVSYGLPGHHGDTTNSRYQVGGTIHKTNCSGKYIVRPPRTMALAQMIPNAISGEAADGTYVIPHFHYDKCEFQLESRANFTIGDSGDATSTEYYWTAIGDASTTEDFTPEGSSHLAAHNLVGSYYTGLSNETTLDVIVRWYIERAPSQKEQDLVVLASASPAYDPHFQVCYTNCKRNLPVGCVYGDNATGDWFKKKVMPALNKAVTFGIKAAPLVAPLLPPQYRAILDAAVRAGSFAQAVSNKRPVVSKKRVAGPSRKK
jgi:hypothetical protein